LDLNSTVFNLLYELKKQKINSAIVHHQLELMPKSRLQIQVVRLGHWIALMRGMTHAAKALV
jgi:hypothetical protein